MIREKIGFRDAGARRSVSIAVLCQVGAMRPSGPWLAATLLTSIGAGIATCAERDALTVVQALMEAQRRTDLNAAMALFADDAVITNATGWKISEKNELRWFINTDIWLRDNFDLAQLQVQGRRVTWVEAATGTFYESIRVGPVLFAFEAIVENGQIASIDSHMPPRDIARIKAACNAAEKEPLFRGRPCSEFVQLIEARSEGLYARAQQGKDAHHDQPKDRGMRHD